jgi:hypothetical protein
MSGSPVFENWIAAGNRQPGEVMFEFPIYSDADGVPEIRDGLGPYQVLRSLREVPSLQDCPSLILRVVRNTWSAHTQTGERIPDEFTSLLSLLSGTRLAASWNYSRRFGFDGDPLGQPIFSHETLVVPKPALGGENLPQVVRRGGISLALLQSFPRLTPEESLVITNAARLYRMALWYSAAQPEFTWLMLVSALETAAAFWQRRRLSPEEQLAEMRPNLRELLIASGGEELLRAAARELADYMGATRKFVGFVKTFSSIAKIQTEDGEKILRVIYGARSKALHSGIAIPPKLPLSLASFEIVCRNALLKWWNSLPALSGAEQAESNNSVQEELGSTEPVPELE